MKFGMSLKVCLQVCFSLFQGSRGLFYGFHCNDPEVYQDMWRDLPEVNQESVVSKRWRYLPYEDILCNESLLAPVDENRTRKIDFERGDYNIFRLVS